MFESVIILFKILLPVFDEQKMYILQYGCSRESKRGLWVELKKIDLRC